jgi:type I restriction enzyme S subunit
MVPGPPPDEQNRIVDAIEEYFSRIDAAETGISQAALRVEQLRQATVSELFGNPNWEWTTFDELADIKGGVTKDAKKQSDPSYVEVPYLRVANVQRGYIDLDEVATICVPPNTLEVLRLQSGDILLNEGGDRDKLGRGWVWEAQIEDCIHQNHVFRARLKNPEMNPRFFSTHANTWGRSWFEKNGKQTTNLASISLSSLKKLPVPVPSPHEQDQVMKELERRASLVDAVSLAVRRTGKKSGVLRRAVLARAFSGLLVAQDPEDESAADLVDRIRSERSSSPTIGTGRKKVTA